MSAGIAIHISNYSHLPLRTIQQGITSLQEQDHKAKKTESQKGDFYNIVAGEVKITKEKRGVEKKVLQSGVTFIQWIPELVSKYAGAVEFSRE